MLAIFLGASRVALGQIDPGEFRMLTQQDGITIQYNTVQCGSERKLGISIYNANAKAKRVTVKLQLVDGLDAEDLPDGIFHLAARSGTTLNCDTNIPHLRPLQVRVKQRSAEVALVSVKIDNP